MLMEVAFIEDIGHAASTHRPLESGRIPLAKVDGQLSQSECPAAVLEEHRVARDSRYWKSHTTHSMLGL